MPNTAVAGGNVDFILPPQKTAEELANLGRNPFISESLPVIAVEKLPPEQGDALATIFVLLRSQAVRVRAIRTISTGAVSPSRSGKCQPS